MYEVVTVATHYEGRLNELINNKYNVPITVLGMGKKWTGFKMKYELIYEYIKFMNDNKIIIFLDGFDSEIVKHPSNALQKFKDNNYKLLFSKEFISNNLLDYAKEKTFTYCKDNIVLNSGLYMGYVKYLKKFLKHNLSQTCKDDQRTANQSCALFDFISVDVTNEIFQNIGGVSKHVEKNVIFVSYPGSITLKRIYRAIFEYGQFFIKWILLLYVFILALFVYKKWHIPLIIVTIIFILYFSMIDRTCV